MNENKPSVYTEVSNENNIRLHKHRVEMLEKAIAAISIALPNNHKDVAEINKIFINYLLCDNEHTYQLICDNINNLVNKK